MNYQFENLVFEGGGIKGIAYGGVLESLEARGIMPNIKQASGTSVGSIAALLVGLGLSSSEVTSILSKMDFKKFLDYNKGILGTVHDACRLFEKYGIASGDYFYSWASNIIKEYTGNPNITFGQFEKVKYQKGFKSIYFIGTDLNSSMRDIYCHKTTPNMKVVDGLRISMSVPLVFEAKRNFRGNICTDGGCVDNYPVRLFDFDFTATSPHSDTSPQKINRQTLGVRLDTTSPVIQGTSPGKRVSTNNLFEFILAVSEVMQSIQTKVHLDSDDWKRTVYVDTHDVGALDFNVTPQKVAGLIESGRQGVKRYFAWYDSVNS